MCGIVGVVSALEREQDVLRGTALLGHRGPDGSGTSVTFLPWGAVSLGMSRLRIVDQRDLSVPFRYPSLGLVLAFNGEVYNWRSLRAELSDGTPWESECDAEVVARAWLRWGPRMLLRFNGMWSLALVDERAGEVFIARDRSGEKPLLFAWTGSDLHFASEAKALGVELQEGPCPEEPALEMDCLETTLFRGVRRLPPGHCLHLRDRSRVSPACWWDLPSELDGKLDKGTAAEELKSLLLDAVRLRSQAEVPVSLLLSGGLDSAIIHRIAGSDVGSRYVCTFPEADNASLARVAGGGDEVLEVTFGLEDLRRELQAIAYHLDTPSSWTAVCLWHLFRKIRADGGKIVLSGEGADELFNGYSRHRQLWYVQQAREDRLLKSYGPLHNHIFGSDREVLARMIDRSPSGTAREAALQVVDRFYVPGRDLLYNAGRIEFYSTMQVLLRMADRMAAAWGLENRSPFLDYRVIELAARMPSRLKVDATWSKAVLRDVACSVGVPWQIVNEETKRGLFLPWASWNGSGSGGRGVWDRGSFASEMKTAWRKAFFGRS